MTIVNRRKPVLSTWYGRRHHSRSFWGYNWYLECFNLHACHGYKYYSISPLKQITEKGGGGGGGVELFISDITGSDLDYPAPHTNRKSLPTYLLNIMVSTTKTLLRIKSQELISHVKQHFMTSPLTYVKSLWNAVSKVGYTWTLTRQHDMR